MSSIFEILKQWKTKMPPIYKILVDCMAWTLWITTMATLWSTLYIGIESGELYNLTDTAPTKYAAFFAVVAFLGLSAVVVMLLAKKME